MESSRLRKGQSLLEVVVAIGLLVLIAGTSFTLLSQMFRETLAGSKIVRARELAAEGIAAVKQMRNSDFSLVASGTHGLALSGGMWGFTGTQDVTDGTYTRTVAVTSVDSSNSDVTVTISWSPVPGRTTSYQASTRVSDWVKTPVPSGSNCTGATVTGDWSHPTVAGSTDIGSGNQGTDVVIKGTYAFVSGTASSSAKSDLFVFDVSNASSPSLVKSIDIGANGINSLFLLGNYLYAASGNDSKEFMVFDVTNPASTSLLASADLSGSADALSVLAADHWAVVGRQNGSASEVVFYDVTDPAHPSITGSFDELGDINDFATDGTHVYAATSSSSAEIVIYDISDPLSPKRTATYDEPGTSDNVSIAYSSPGVLLVGDQNNKLTVLDATDVAHLSVSGSYNAGGYVQDITCVTGNLGFLATTNSTKEFTILNISDLNAITEYASFNFPQVATGAVFANNKVYVSVRSNDALRIISPGP